MARTLAILALLVVGVPACNRPKSETLTTTTTSAAATTDLDGSYTISSSTNAGGAPGYTGKVNVAKLGGVYTLDWTVLNTPPYKGVGLVSGSRLAVGWGMGGQYGVVVYEIGDKGMNGKWAIGGSSGVGTEDLEGPANLDGVYKIVRAVNPQGQSYAGTVAVHPTGDTYGVTWKLASGESYSGVGVKDGNLLVVGWGIGGKGAGVVDYEIRGATLSGKWATPGGTQLGTEVLSR